MNRIYRSEEKETYKKEFLLGLLFVIPYMESFIGGTWRVGSEAVGRSIIVILLIIIAMNIPQCMLTGNSTTKRNGLEVCFCLYSIAVLFINTRLKANNVSTLLWMTVPLACALSVRSRVIHSNLNHKRIIYYGTCFFSAYSILLVLYNIIALNIFTSGRRLTALAGGSVIYGYTIAVYFALVITNRDVFSYSQTLFLKLLFTFIVVLTGSRGGVWPIILLWIFDFVRRDFSYKRLLCSLLILLIFVIINPVDYVYEYMPRLFIYTDSSRIASNDSAIQALLSFDSIDLLLGRGPGNFFPYQAWVNRNVDIGSSMGNSNVFYFNGLALLVQPHNSFLYYLLELGSIGLMLILAIISKNVIHRFPSKRFIDAFVLVGTVVVVNLFDSILIVEPGISFVMWLIILLT